MDHYWQTDWGCINREQPKHTSFFLIRDGSSSDAVSIILLSQNEKYWHFFQLGRLRAIFLILVYWMHAIVIIFLLPMRNRICYAYIFPKKHCKNHVYKDMRPVWDISTNTVMRTCCVNWFSAMDVYAAALWIHEICMHILAPILSS